MIITTKCFPKTLQDKILSGVKKRQLNIKFIDGAYILTIYLKIHLLSLLQ